MSQVQETKNLTGILKLAVLSVVSLCLASCGGGGGSDDSSNEPAPQTMNGVIIRLSPAQGPVLTLIRSGGDALAGGEIGNVTMAANPGNFQTVDPGGNLSLVRISPRISGVSYIYTRTAPEGGRLVVSGTGLDTVPGTTPPAGYEYFGGNFSRTYDILFATDGTNITTIAIQDYVTADGISGAIQWGNGSLRLFGGGLVPVGWNVERSQSLTLPKIYPRRLSGESMELTLVGPPLETQRVFFLESTFTRFTDKEGDFIEKGIGNLFIGDSPDPETINFEYAPDPTTTNKVKLRIFRGLPGPSRVEYVFTFENFENGQASVNNVAAGTFRFPFLEGN